jgi:hypothetical protein
MFLEASGIGPKIGGLSVRTLGNKVGLISALALAAVFVAGAGARAQQTPSQPVKQEVPDNPLHTPGPVQPIPYSHKTHLALGLQCQMCHVNPAPGNQMTFPATSTCMTCHANVAKDKPAIQKLAGFAASQQPVPWVRAYQLLPGVNWSHRTHLQAGMMCEMCHGQVSTLDVMAEVTSVTTMAVCLNCHVAHNGKTVCVTCHSWPPPQP